MKKGVTYKSMGINLSEEERVCFNNGFAQGLQEGKLIAEDWVSEAFKAMKRDLNPYTGDYGLGFNYDSMCEYMESYLKDHFGEQYYEKR